MNNPTVVKVSSEQSFAGSVQDLHVHKMLWVGLDLAASCMCQTFMGELANIIKPQGEEPFKRFFYENVYTSKVRC